MLLWHLCTQSKYTEGSVPWSDPKAPLDTACALLCNRESLQGWCSFPPPSQVQLALFFQECTPLKQEREEYPLQKTHERIKLGEWNLSRFSLWEFFVGAPCHDRSGIYPSVSQNTMTHLPQFCLGLLVSSCTNMAQVIHSTCWLSWLFFFLVPEVFCCWVSVLLCFCPRISSPPNSVFYSRAGHRHGHLVFRFLSMFWARLWCLWK